jgi:hypothetical protein
MQERRNQLRSKLQYQERELGLGSRVVCMLLVSGKGLKRDG